MLRAVPDELGAPIGASVVMPGMRNAGMVTISTTPASVVAANMVNALRWHRHDVYSDLEASRQVAARLGSIVDARAEDFGPELGAQGSPRCFGQLAWAPARQKRTTCPISARLGRFRCQR